jgi:NifU-like protein
MGRNDLITGNVWEDYSNKVQERMNNPKYLGEFSEEEAKAKGLKLVVADFGAEACGDAVRLYWLVDPETNIIKDARFKSFGCGTAIASSDMMTELTIGKTIDEATKITNLDVEKALRDTEDKPAFPPQKMHCSVMAYDVIIEAAAKYKGVDSKSLRDEEIVCECARTTRGEIEEIIKTHHCKTVEELQKYTKAGTYCKSCVAPGGHEEKAVYLVDILAEMNENSTENKDEPKQEETEEKFENLTLLQKIKKIEDIINQKIRPALAMDGGSLELIDVKEDEDGLKLMIRYLGACQGCASSSSTLWAIEQELINHTGYEKIKVIEVK